MINEASGERRSTGSNFKDIYRIPPVNAPTLVEATQIPPTINTSFTVLQELSLDCIE